MAAGGELLFQDGLDRALLREQPQNTTRRNVRLRGHSCEFVQRPSGGVMQTKCVCPICSLVLREPYQVTCCGSVLCQSCIQDVQNAKKVCPTCQEDFSIFPDESFKRSLYARKVSCSHRGAGCEWVGQLGELDQHLNLLPSPEKLLVGCQFFQVECSYCMQPFQRRYIHAHQSENCPMRPYTCQHCTKYATTFDDVTQTHWPVCPLYPLSCPNNCDLVLKRHELEYHLNQECPLTLVDCDFYAVGCQVQLLRKDLQSHLTVYVTEHVRLQQKVIVQMQNVVTQYRQENEQLREALQTKEDEIQVTLTKHQQKLEEMLYTGTLPFDFVMKDFEQHKTASECWYSPPFYTHTHGYRMCVAIWADGYEAGKRTHLSVYVRLMQGVFDDNLQWPFEGTLMVQLINQLDDGNHYTRSIDFAQATDPAMVNKVISGARAERGYGEPTFIAYAQLDLSTDQNSQYLADDQLKFRVSKITEADPTSRINRRCLALERFAGAIEPKVSVAPIEFSLLHFEEQKSQDAVWTSPAFYTHSRGYRMCLQVMPNGYNDGRGTHVSIFACMMRGPFDAHLKWPFRGDVFVRIMNSTGDIDHQKTIPYNEETHDRNAGRVTDRERSSALGYSKFLSHSSLSCNATTIKNSQMDTFTIKISVKLKQ